MPLKIKGKTELAGVVTKNGEFIPLEFMISAFIPRNPRDKEPYTKVYGEKVLKLIEQNEIKGSDLKVFLWFVAKNSNKDNWNNEWINVDYKELARELGVTDRTIRNSIKTLLELKLIVQWKKRIPSFRLNPDYCFRGGVIGKVKVKNEVHNHHIEKENYEQFVACAVESVKGEEE